LTPKIPDGGQPDIRHLENRYDIMVGGRERVTTDEEEVQWRKYSGLVLYKSLFRQNNEGRQDTQNHKKDRMTHRPKN